MDRQTYTPKHARPGRHSTVPPAPSPTPNGYQPRHRAYPAASITLSATSHASVVRVPQQAVRENPPASPLTRVAGMAASRAFPGGYCSQHGSVIDLEAHRNLHHRGGHQ